MKRILSVLTALILFISLIPSVYALTGRYVVTAEYTPVYKSPNITSEIIAEVTKNTYLDITEIRSTGFGKAYIAKDGVTGWVPVSAIEKADILSGETDIKELIIKSFPNKTKYIDGREELDLKGLVVSAVKKDGRETIISSYNVFAPEMKGPGTKTVKISFSPDSVNYFYVSFTVEVVRVPVKSISIVSLPSTEYKEHGKLDLSGLKIKTEFEDPSDNKTYTFDEIAKNPDFIISGCHGEKHEGILEKGEHEISISYMYSDVSCSFKVNVIPRVLTSLEIVTPPDSLKVFDKTNPPELYGLVLKASYDNGETETVYHYDCKAVCDPSQFVIGPENEVKVYYGELYVTLKYTYTTARPEGIKVVPPSPVLKYPKGEVIDLSGVKVYLYYTDGSFEEVTDFTVSEVNYSFIGTQNIVIKYKEYSETLPIIISAIFSKGDVNADGKVTAGDARTVLRASIGFTKLAGETFFAGDADRNDKITAADARLILRASIGLENLYITL